jgi:thiosulfate/3-mercaptopyruvate sulfurtransferase
MSLALPGSVVATDWLSAAIGRADIKIVDASFFLPSAGRNARTGFEQAHIPGAVFFDIDEIANKRTDLPHMLPTAEQFSAQVGALGIGDGDAVIAYDQAGMGSAPRAWWMFRVFGHDSVAVLDGGLPKWQREGRPISIGSAGKPTPKSFRAKFKPLLVRSRAQIAGNLDGRIEQVVDARAAGRFKGVDPEPREGLRAGHIPGSLNVPYAGLLDPQSGELRPAGEIRAAFLAGHVDLDRPIVTTCGSGVTACVLALGLHRLGRTDVAVYDGSWSEWGRPGDTPVER